MENDSLKKKMKNHLMAMIPNWLSTMSPCEEDLLVRALLRNGGIKNTRRNWITSYCAIKELVEEKKLKRWEKDGKTLLIPIRQVDE